VALNPRLSEAYDLKAELLAQAQRYEEALAACRPSFSNPPPLLLRGRAAWLGAQRGNLAEAIRQMRAAVAEDATYYWGWLNLADWYRASGSAADYLEAAEQLVRLAPHSPVPLGYRGEARLRAADRAGAQEDFRRAFELAPDYTFAGLQLVDLLLGDSAFDEAAKVLDGLRTRDCQEQVLLRDVQLAAGRANREAAAAALRQLYILATADPGLVHQATQTVLKAGWPLVCEEAMQAALAAPTVNPFVGKVWVDVQVAQGRWSCGKRLDELLARGDVGLHALVAYVEALGQAKRRWQLGRYLRRYRDRLRAQAWSWGTAGYALGTAGAFRKAVAWMEDWSQRGDLEPWMLLNQALYLRYLGRDEEAHQVNRAALDLPLRDWASSPHVIWVALGEVLTGAGEPPADRLRQVDPATLDPYYLCLYFLVEALLLSQQATVDERQVAFVKAREWLRQAVHAYPACYEDRVLRRFYRRCVWRIAKNRGGVRAFLWACMA
jgi:tetratricopeptide (TPR) repeat protein